MHALLLDVVPVVLPVDQLPLMRAAQAVALDVVLLMDVMHVDLLVVAPDVVHVAPLVVAPDVAHVDLLDAALDVESVADVERAEFPLNSPPNQWESTTQLISTTQ